VFDSGKHIHPSFSYAFKPWELTRFTLGGLLRPTHKEKVSMETYATVKYSSLLQKIVNYGVKIFSSQTKQVHSFQFYYSF
jgi:hypothetical protein